MSELRDENRKDRIMTIDGINERFVLNRKYSIRLPSANEKRMAPKLYRDHSILEHKYRNVEYRISNEIRGFLKYFSKPHTLFAVIASYRRKYRLPEDKLGPVLSTFFTQLKEKGILVSERHNQKAYKTTPVYLRRGQEIGNYVILESLVTDRPVQVYKVKGADQKIYILKLASILADPHYLNRVRQEFQVLTRLSKSRYTIRAKDHLKIGDYEATVIEYFEGDDFADFLDNNSGKLSLAQKLVLADKILNAFSYLHRKNIIHGDIHLGNLLVNPRQEIRLIDFGLANHANPAKNLDIRFGGANYFMPPERISINSFGKFTKEADYLSDVYQAGLLIYYLFFGRLPYKAVLWKDLATRIKKGKLPFPGRLTLSPVGKEIKNILTKAIHPEPSKRFRTATAFHLAWKKMINRYDSN